MKRINSIALSTALATASFAPMAAGGTYTDMINDAGNSIATATAPTGLVASEISNIRLYTDHNGNDVDFIKFNIPDPHKFTLSVPASNDPMNVGLFRLDGTGIKNSMFLSVVNWTNLQPIYDLSPGVYVLYTSLYDNHAQTKSGQNIFPTGKETLPQTNEPLDHFSNTFNSSSALPLYINIGGIESVPAVPAMPIVAMTGLLAWRRQR